MNLESSFPHTRHHLSPCGRGIGRLRRPYLKKNAEAKLRLRRIDRCDPGEGLRPNDRPCPLTPTLSHKGRGSAPPLPKHRAKASIQIDQITVQIQFSNAAFCSLPPCGGGLGRGVSRKVGARGYPPLQLSPARGERAD